MAHLYAQREIGWDYGGDFFSAIMVMGLITGTFFIIVQGHGISKGHNKEIVTYNIPLASLNDNSQINGKFSGSLFVRRGTINQVEYFSFYKANGDGSYSLDKKEADRSVIFPDTPADRAYVRITDEITRCKREATWYYMFGCDTTTGIYVRGEFHVPEGSIAEDFALDAQ